MKRMLSALALAGVVTLGFGPFGPIGTGISDISWGASTIKPPAL